MSAILFHDRKFGEIFSPNIFHNSENSIGFDWFEGLKFFVGLLIWKLLYFLLVESCKWASKSWIFNFLYKASLNNS